MFMFLSVWSMVIDMTLEPRHWCYCYSELTPDTIFTFAVWCLSTFTLFVFVWQVKPVVQSGEASQREWAFQGEELTNIPTPSICI